MPEFLQAALLGFVQGLTEFLPVSSSGHLVLFQALLGQDFSFADSPLVFDLVLHMGTLLPVLLYYRRDLLGLLAALGGRSSEETREARRLIGLLVLATLPTGLMGVLLKDSFERVFHEPMAVFIALGLTGLLLASTRWAPRRDLVLGVPIALALGVAQGLAITPGVSRSGTTIAVGLWLGLDRVTAARFSFLMSIPAILGAMLLTAKDVASVDAARLPMMGLGFCVAATSGYFALAWLVRLVRSGRFWAFAGYLIPLSLLGLLALT
ncbi:MAG: undecaprenyl-diphosphate phosphatase [Myxococcota bacterium]